MSAGIDGAVDAAQRLLDASDGYLFSGIAKSHPSDPLPFAISASLALDPRLLPGKEEIFGGFVDQFFFELTRRPELTQAEVIERLHKGVVKLSESTTMDPEVGNPVADGSQPDPARLADDDWITDVNRWRESTQQWFELAEDPFGFRVGVIMPEDRLVQTIESLAADLSYPPWNRVSDPVLGGVRPEARRFLRASALEKEPVQLREEAVDWIATEPYPPEVIENVMLAQWALIVARITGRDPSDFVDALEERFAR